MKQFHMIAGLPRSGSTLLSAILSQNPRFYAKISDPLNGAMNAAIREFSVSGAATQCTEEQKLSALNGFIDGYYKHIDKPVVFNTSRFWTGFLHVMDVLRPDAKVICCVRDIPWIINSFEILHKNSPTLFAQLPALAAYVSKNGGDGYNDVYKRCDVSYELIRKNLNNLKEGFFSPYREKILFVEYEHLAREPQKTMKAIYKFIGEPYFKHDFNNVESSHDEFDLDVQHKDLHKTRKKVEFLEKEPVIPPDIWVAYKGQEFWRDFTSQ